MFGEGLLKERIINKNWRKIIASRGETIPDNRLTPTFYKLSLGRCSHQKSLSVAETWALSIDITCCIDIHRMSIQPSTDIRLRFADAFASANKVCLSLVMCPGFLPVLPRNVFYEDHTMLVVIFCTVRQSFPYQLLFQCWDPYDILH
jgi:hypothetical protein